MTDNDDGQDTQVLVTDQTPFDLEGTEEMDRAAIMAQLHAHTSAKAAVDAEAEAAAESVRPTEQLVAVSEQTVPSSELTPKHQVTQHYVVPDSLLDQIRDPHFKTLDIPMEAIVGPADPPTVPRARPLSFQATVDPTGKISLPKSALNRFPRGVKVEVVLQLVDD